MIELDRRATVTRETLATWKLRPFEWGASDCVKMAVAHARAMGHDVKLAKAGSYKTAIGAKRALRHAGFATVANALDTHFPRWPAPAFARTGDFVMGEGDTVFGAIGIMLGNQALLGFHEMIGHADVLRGVSLAAAWRVDPR